MAAWLILAAAIPSAGQSSYLAAQDTRQTNIAEQIREAVQRAIEAERTRQQARAERAAAERAAVEADRRQAATDRAAAEQARQQTAADRAAIESATAERADTDAAARQAAADRERAEAAASQAERKAADQAVRTGTNGGGGPPPDSNKASDATTNAAAEDRSWLVPLLLGAGGMLALVLAGWSAKRILWPPPPPPPLPLPYVAVDPSLDRSNGSVAGDKIAFAGPEVRLSAVLAPGATTFEGGEPIVVREERDD